MKKPNPMVISTTVPPGQEYKDFPDSLEQLVERVELLDQRTNQFLKMCGLSAMTGDTAYAQTKETR
jgi:hypothetical protein